MASKTEELEFEIYQQIQGLDSSDQAIIYKNIRSIKFNMIGYGQLLAGKDDAKFGKTQEGKEYFTFSLCVNSFLKDMSDSTERTHSQVFIRIFVYDKKQIEYLHKVKAHRGQRASIFGRLSSFKNEYRGNTFMTMNVICRDINITKTKQEENEK